MVSRNLSYVPSLDGLRAVGIALVLVTHGAKPVDLPGGYGVDVFFVLSGFLITTLLWQEWQSAGHLEFGKFYLRRAIRLYPALLTMLTGAFILGIILTRDAARLAIESLAAALYVTPFTDALLGPPLFTGHLWTLAVEEWFYLIWPVMLLLFLRMRLRWQTIAWITIGGGILMYAARVGAIITADIVIHPLRAGGIAIGCGIALIIANSKARGNGSLLAALGVASLVGAWFLSTHEAVTGLNPVAAAGGTVALIFAIFGTTRTIVQRVLELAPFTYVGRVSYEVYLWHVPFLLGAAMITGLERNKVWWWAYPLAFAVSAATHAAYLPLQRRLRARVSRIHAHRAVAA